MSGCCQHIPGQCGLSERVGEEGEVESSSGLREPGRWGDGAFDALVLCDVLRDPAILPADRRDEAVEAPRADSDRLDQDKRAEPRGGLGGVANGGHGGDGRSAQRVADEPVRCVRDGQSGLEHPAGHWNEVTVAQGRAFARQQPGPGAAEARSLDYHEPGVQTFGDQPEALQFERVDAGLEAERNDEAGTVLGRAGIEVGDEDLTAGSGVDGD
jgi:hypothetical protein